MKKVNKERSKMNVEQKKEIQALKLFLPVVVALFVTNVVPVIFYGSLVYTRNWYRELSTGVAVAVAVNSAVNFFIYFYKGSSFKAETKKLLAKWTGFETPVEKDLKNAKGTGSSDCTTLNQDKSKPLISPGNFKKGDECRTPNKNVIKCLPSPVTFKLDCECVTPNKGFILAKLNENRDPIGVFRF